jgi:hypothetical protein
MSANINLEVKSNMLYIRYYYDGKKALFSLGLEISQEFCDQKTNSICQSHPNASKINYQIGLFSDKIHKAIIILEHQGIKPYPAEIKNLVLNSDSKDKKTDFWLFFDKYLNEKQNNIRPATFTNYMKLKRLLLDFQATYKYKVTFESINANFYNQFQNYFISKNLQVNYFASIFLSLKSILNNAESLNIKVNSEIHKKSFSVSKIKSDSVYLMKMNLKA